MQIAGPQPGVSDPVGLVQGLRICILTTLQAMLIWLVLGLHLENHWFRLINPRGNGATVRRKIHCALIKKEIEHTRINIKD